MDQEIKQTRFHAEAGFAHYGLLITGLPNLARLEKTSSVIEGGS